MGGNISIGKPQNIVPSHGNDVSLDFIQTHWSKNITAFTVEPVMAETRPGVEKPDGGGASGPSIVRLRLTWADGQFSETQPETCILKTEDNSKDPKFDLGVRVLFQFSKFIPVELQANECLWYKENSKLVTEKGYRMPKCYAAVASHDTIKIPSFNKMVFFDARQKFRKFHYVYIYILFLCFFIPFF